MLDKLTSTLDFQTKALVLRAERQSNLASNIANADTPGYSARDVNFADALRNATGPAGAAFGSTANPTRNSGPSHPRHIAFASTAGIDGEAGFVLQTQPALDGNSVDLDRERAAFADNAVRYEATLRFINGQGKTLLAAIQGQ
ncbi:MAG: flagellar basal body rod protein FlgB [Burkholderiales bacterium]